METKYPADERVWKFVKTREWEPEEHTRTFMQSGERGLLQHWIETLQKSFNGDLIPYEWVPEYVGVSRVAVMKRAKKGQITVFGYRIEENYATWDFKTRSKPTRRVYKYVPVDECKAWILDAISDPGYLSISEVRQMAPAHVSGWWNKDRDERKKK